MEGPFHVGQSTDSRFSLFSAVSFVNQEKIVWLLHA